MMDQMDDLARVDPAIYAVIEREQQRQLDKLVFGRTGGGTGSSGSHARLLLDQLQYLERGGDPVSMPGGPLLPNDGFVEEILRAQGRGTPK